MKLRHPQKPEGRALELSNFIGSVLAFGQIDIDDPLLLIQGIARNERCDHGLVVRVGQHDQRVCLDPVRQKEGFASGNSRSGFLCGKGPQDR